MSTKRILFIVRSFQHSSPQPIRFQKITSFLKEYYDIHILMLHHGKGEEVQNEEGLTIHKLPYSKLGKLINKEISHNTNSSTIQRKEGRTSLFKQILIKIKLRSIIFPDSLIFEIKRLRKKLKSLIVNHNYDIIVGSSFPHTILMLSATAKKVKPTVKWIHDLGDPLYSPRNGYRIRAILSYIYERNYSKHINSLVVTNTATKEYYTERYKRYNNDNVHVVRQGADIEPYLICSKVFSFPLKMVYAGTFYDRLREPFTLYKALSKHNDTVVLDLYGQISKRHLPKTRTKNIVFWGSTPYNVILEKYKNSDIVLFVDNAYGLQTPGKVFEVIATQKPILCIYQNVNSASIEIFKKIPYVFVCDNSVESITETLKLMFEAIENKTIKFDYNLLNLSWKKRAFEYRAIIEN